MRLVAPLCLSLILLSPATAGADIYSCEGPDGTTHLTNIRPRGMRCTVMVREREQPRAATGRARPSPGSSPARRRRGPRDPQRYQRYDAHIQEASRLYQLPVPFIRAVIKVESDFNPEVVSHAGAVGLMQLMPRTAASMGVQSSLDPRQNILGGTRYLRILANRFNGDLVLTVAAYNAGGGAVRRYRGVPPYRETRRYVRRVLHYYYSFRQPTAAAAR